MKLVIIGAGPKALAIAAKNEILSELGFETPEIHIVEKKSVGANWTGLHGFTNGKLRLGTSPEKDIGFPYQTQDWSPEMNTKIDHRMLRFSWLNFLIQQEEYSHWIDRGRPAPTHAQWAQYLQWIAAQLKKNTVFHFGEVTHLGHHGTFWTLEYVGVNGRLQKLDAQGVMLTGPGHPRIPFSLPAHPRVLSVENFWKFYPELRKKKNLSIGIVGTGENAASAAMVLSDENKDCCLSLSIISPQGMAFSRGESYQENSVYSDPTRGHWAQLTEEDRRHFIHRTDRGVFSQYANSILNQNRNFRIIPGRLIALRADCQEKVNATLEYHGVTDPYSFDYLVIATGSDQSGVLKELMDDGDQGRLCETLGIKELSDLHLERLIQSDMSVSSLMPKLHLPMLSGINQGPGFANLSCLGRLSDRVLETYVKAHCLIKSSSQILTA